MLAEFFCSACRAPFLSPYPLDEQGRCAVCRAGVRGFDEAYSFGFYANELRELIQLLKYGKIQTLATPLGRLLLRALPREQRFDLIVPMPMHWRKRWQRGFNQAELLASRVERGTGVPVVKAVRRMRHGRAQAGLTSAKRRANVAGAFHVNKPESVKGKRVLLIDDVLTTGSTAAECARVMRRAGASHIALLTVARADRRRAAPTIEIDTDTFPESTFSGSLEHAKSGSFA